MTSDAWWQAAAAQKDANATTSTLVCASAPIGSPTTEISQSHPLLAGRYDSPHPKLDEFPDEGPVAMQETEKIWMNGELVDWADAKVHVLSHGLHYGSGVFEGIRAYETDRGTGVFRLREHLRRLQRSAEVYYMELPYSLDELRQATHDTLAANEIGSCYVRPIAFRGYGELGVNPLNCPVDVVIAVWPWGAYLGEEALETGVRVTTSSLAPDRSRTRCRPPPRRRGST